MSDEKTPEELLDVELPPVEPFNEPFAEAPVDVELPSVETVDDLIVEAPVEDAPPLVEVVAEPVVETSFEAVPPPAEPVKSWPAPSAAASDNKLWALLSYVLSPVVPVIILLMQEKKNEPDLKPHAMQALVAGVAIIVITMILGVIPVIGCLSPIVALAGWIAMIYWGFQAYNGKPVTIPVVTNLVKSQGWA